MTEQGQRARGRERKYVRYCDANVVSPLWGEKEVERALTGELDQLYWDVGVLTSREESCCLS